MDTAVPNDSVDGLMWLPRMIDKARRYERHASMNGYLYGDNDFIDAPVLNPVGQM